MTRIITTTTYFFLFLFVFTLILAATSLKLSAEASARAPGGSTGRLPRGACRHPCTAPRGSFLLFEKKRKPEEGLGFGLFLLLSNSRRPSGLWLVYRLKDTTCSDFNPQSTHPGLTRLFASGTRVKEPPDLPGVPSQLEGAPGKCVPQVILPSATFV